MCITGAGLPHALEAFLVAQPIPAFHERLTKIQGIPAGYKFAFQTVSRLRPRARRDLITFRPPRVFIRLKKPCTRMRRRDLG